MPHMVFMTGRDLVYISKTKKESFVTLAVRYWERGHCIRPWRAIRNEEDHLSLRSNPKSLTNILDT